MTADRRLQPDRRRNRGRRITDLAKHDQVHVRMGQVVEYFNVDRRTVMKWVENGDLPALKLDVVGGVEWRFKIADLVALERKLEHRPSADSSAAEPGHP